jgi:hypothetical protein
LIYEVWISRPKNQPCWELREFSEKIQKKGRKISSKEQFENYKKNEIICKAKIEKIE